MRFEPLDPNSVSDRDLALLREAVKQDCNEPKAETVVELARRGEVLIWRLSDGPEGVVVVQKFFHDGGAELFIWLLAGSGIFEHRKFIVETLEEFSRVCGSNKVRTIITQPAVARILKNLGFEEVGVCLKKETGNG